jgi:hypothetical protein
MAKSQKRSNREKKKPKATAAAKSVAAASTAPASRAVNIGGTRPAGKKR